MELWLARQPLTPRTPKEEVKTIMYHVGELLSMLVAAASGEDKGRLAGQQLEKQYHDGFIDIESILLLRTESKQNPAAAVASKDAGDIAAMKKQVEALTKQQQQQQVPFPAPEPTRGRGRGRGNNNFWYQFRGTPTRFRAGRGGR